MLQRTVSYKTLLRIVGVCFLLYGLYIIVVVLTSRMSARGDIVYDGPWVFEDPGAVMNYIFCGGWFFGNPVLPANLYIFGPFTPGPLFCVGIRNDLLKCDEQACTGSVCVFADRALVHQPICLVPHCYSEWYYKL